MRGNLKRIQPEDIPELATYQHHAFKAAGYMMLKVQQEVGKEGEVDEDGKERRVGITSYLCGPYVDTLIEAP